MPRKNTLYAVLLDRVGFRKTNHVLTFVLAWATARALLEDDDAWPETISGRIAAYSDWWKQSHASSWRELALWREALPEFEDPDAFLEMARDQLGAAYRPEAVVGVVMVA